MSEELVLSIKGLQSSASSALLATEASASSAILTLEASASHAVAAGRESAARSVSEAFTIGPSGVATVTVTATTQAAAETSVEVGQDFRLTIIQTAVAVVASVIGSSLFSLLGFYLFIRHRKAQEKQQEEEQEAVQEVNAALDRAIVSYIVKEHPSPTDMDSDPQQQKQQQKIGYAVMSEPRDSTSSSIIPPGSPHIVRNTSRELNRRTASSEFLSTVPSYTYGEIPARLLEPTLATVPKGSVGAEVDTLERRSVVAEVGSKPPERRDSKWPLTGSGWL
ncbi:hypothetical protein B0H63DRAFT_447326 [Podospora didyma]|uniref:Transmembrane protein n=1 Tax=Podospora didyma TaxID=330526 RepID=A0AAE0P130_9PEZI|nr:hypothetical protein B0H63DRAFT_447326 [Podospora didyma]